MPIDIDKSFYNTGTASVINDGTTVTGQGTLWAQALRAGDLFGTHVGAGIRIAAIVSNTQLMLAHEWSGPSQTASTYEVQLTPYDVGYQQAVRELLTVMASGNLEALASLTGEADKIPYFTGPGAMALIDIATLGGSGGAGGWDALVGTLAGRDAFDGEAPGFRVMVADNGAGQAVIYEKTATGWSMPVPFTGPAGNDGPVNTLEVGSVTSGEVAYVTIRGTAPNQIVDFVLQRGADGEPGPMGDVTPAALAAKDAAEAASGAAAGSATAAAGSAGTATTKAGDAAASASAAADSAATASTKSGEATTSETNAGNSATTAATKAGEAADSADAAAGSASTASTKAGEASSSASDASDSAIAAAGSAGTASTHAGIAITQAEAASDSASDAVAARDASWAWSSEAENTPVDDGTHQGFSAFHWSEKAKGYAGGGVQTVNGHLGPDVVLDASDVGAATEAQGALADTAMQPSTYDPGNKAADAFDRNNHTGTMPLAALEATGASRFVYGRNGASGSAAQIMISGAASANTVPIRDASGLFEVATPTTNTHPATKKYVDDALPTAAVLSVWQAGASAVAYVISPVVMKGLLDGRLSPYQTLALKGVANGYPELNSSGKVPTTQLPDASLGALKYQGTWNASTNTPAIPAAASGNMGWYYMVQTAGSTAVDGTTDWQVGDWIVSNGARWDKIDNTDAVSSVAGLTGPIAATALKIALALTKADVGLGNAANTAPADMPVSDAQAAADALRVLKANDTGLGGFTSALKSLGNLSGTTVALAATTSNFQIGQMDGSFTLAAPVGDQQTTILLYLWNSIGTMTATGFNKANGAIKPGKDHVLTITCIGSYKKLDIEEATS